MSLSRFIGSCSYLQYSEVMISSESDILSPARYKDMMLHTRVVALGKQAANLLLFYICATAASLTWAHGSVDEPVSRIYNCYNELQKGQLSSACQAAVNAGGSQMLYDWNAVRNSIPDYSSDIPNFKAVVPDGSLCGGGNSEYSGINIIRDDWVSTKVTSGSKTFTWKATAQHNPSKWYFYLTTEKYDPSQPLTWENLALIGREGDIHATAGGHYTLKMELPQRTGKHLLYVIWQRIDPAGEAFFSCSDLYFDSSSSSD